MKVRKLLPIILLLSLSAASAEDKPSCVNLMKIFESDNQEGIISSMNVADLDSNFRESVSCAKAVVENRKSELTTQDLAAIISFTTLGERLLVEEMDRMPDCRDDSLPKKKI